jgi:predicted hydrocarbon binding protein
MPQNPKKIILMRRQLAAKFYLRGYHAARIAEEIGKEMGRKFSRPQISADLQILAKEWRESALFDIGAAKAKELAKINNLETEYWEAWEKSKKDYIEKSRKKKTYKNNEAPEAHQEDDIKNMQSIEIGSVKKRATGNAAFLAGIQWCIEKRIKLLGLDNEASGDRLKRDFETYEDAEIIEILSIVEKNKKAGESEDIK